MLSPAGAGAEHNQITNAAKIAFPPSIYAMTAVLDKANLWSVSPTSPL
jgi:hypothetical protein